MPAKKALVHLTWWASWVPQGQAERQCQAPGSHLEAQERPSSGWPAAHVEHQPAPQANTWEEPMSSAHWKLPRPAHHQPQPGAPWNLPSLSVWEGNTYLNIEQVELHRVSRVHILIRVKELPSQQQRFIFIHSLFSECPAVIQPIYCNTTRQRKELLIFPLT